MKLSANWKQYCIKPLLLIVYHDDDKPISIFVSVEGWEEHFQFMSTIKFFYKFHEREVHIKTVKCSWK